MKNDSGQGSEDFAKQSRKPKSPGGSKVSAGSSDAQARDWGGGPSKEQRQQQDGSTTPSGKGTGRQRVPQGGKK